MNAKNYRQEIKQEEIMDDINLDKKETAVVSDVDQDKLAQLKAKLQQTNKETSQETPKRDKSLKIGVVGSGQAGSRLASEFYKKGYDAVVLNTAEQDLKFIEVPEKNKLLLQYGLGGAAKSLEIGSAAAQEHQEKIMQLVNNQLADAQVLLFTTSLGGGSGAGSVEVLVDILSSTNKPLMVLVVLPGESDDAQTKANALETLAKLTKYAQQKKVNNLIVVDNAKIEVLYKDVSQMDFFNVANRVIVEPLDVFNTMSMAPSNVKSLDPMELAKLFTDSEGLSIYGEMSVSNYTEDTALAEAIINNVSNNLLVSGFNIKQSKYVGFMVLANKNVWSKIPAVSVSYATSMINELCTSPLGVFKGVYETDDPTDAVKIYSFFGGLGLPETRISQLRQETEHAAKVVKEKNEQRNVNLTMETKEEFTSAAEKVKQKIAQKSSAFGKLIQQTTIDKRNK